MYTQTKWQTHPWVAEGRGRLRFGIAGGPQAAGHGFLDFVRLVEELGFDSYWHGDHPGWNPDCWVNLTALALSTKAIRLGVLVSCIYYRLPMVTARAATDVDRLSNGRLLLGLGIGDAESEFAALGLPFPPARERQSALEETIQILSGIWSNPTFSYSGRQFRVSNARVQPGPVQKPHIPILIGGGGERVTLRQVARYSDMSNFAPHEWAGSAFTLQDVKRKLNVLRQHCEAIDRPYDSLLKSYLNFPVVLAENTKALEKKLHHFGWDEFYKSCAIYGTPMDALAYYQELADLGIGYFIAYISGNDIETLHILAEEVLPKLAVR